MEIRYVDSGLANNYGDYVELNKHLKDWPKLHNAILEHELSHTNQKGFTKKDFIIDISPSKVNTFELMKFMINHPKSLLQFFPVYMKDKTIFYDINMLIAWGVTLGSIGIAIFLSLR